MEIPGGAKKLGLYSLLIFLALLTSLNIGLTLWLMSALHFDMEGTGPIQFVKNGLKIDGATYVMDTLTTSKISTTAPSLHLSSPRHVHLSSSASRLVLKHNTELHSSNLTVTSTEGVEVFSVGQEGVRLGTGRVVSHTATLGSALQCPVVQSAAGQSLSIQSPTSTLGLYGPSGVRVEAAGGEVRLSAYRDVKIATREGKVILNTGSVLLPRLPIVHTNISINNYSKSLDREDITIHQVCSCSNGRLFLAPAKSHCYGRVDVCKE
eukprot:GFUD01010489.1.p1 GENE.GFUD01010489.1~~GFUD01010489.1.p1  ORF type:complete len:265 (+),score=76.96 GFUD01010489.1:37-831(+)